MTVACPSCDDEFGDEHARNIHHKMAHGESLVKASNVDCPSCGASFANTHGMRIHHTIVHGESIAKTTLKCDFCGDCFEEYKSLIDKRDDAGRFCSEECLGKANWARLNKQTECPYCGDSFPNRLTMLSHHVHQHGESLSNTITLSCDECESKFEVSPNGDHRKFCSRECYLDNRVNRERPDKRPERQIPYSSLWERRRLTALERDDYCCVECGITDEEHTNRFGQGLHVHHIQALRNFNDPQEAHKPGNLETLCLDCHNKETHS